MDGTQRARAFLARHHMAPDLGDPAQLCAALRGEMARGLAGEDSSLLMLPAYVSLGRPLPRRGQAVALDMGGTHLRTALADYRGETAAYDSARLPQFARYMLAQLSEPD